MRRSADKARGLLLTLVAIPSCTDRLRRRRRARPGEDDEIFYFGFGVNRNAADRWVHALQILG
jgi:hypothetical protein